MAESSNDSNAERLRLLPQLGRLLDAAAGPLPETPGLRRALADALRRALDEARATLRADPAAPVPDDAALIGRAEAIRAAWALRGLRPVINATGIVLHTNLGRAPLAEEAVAAAAAAAGGYATLEFDLAHGSRGDRLGAVEALVRDVTGAAASVAVNNAAAAMLLALAAHAPAGDGPPGEVIVSRGELVEIGGGFRIPDVIRQGGATLVEVGTTNRTRIDDYAAAIGPRTRMLLKVHRSNFRIVGFTEEAGLGELAALARAHGLVLLHDLGSGMIEDPRPAASRRTDEPTVRRSVEAGCDLVAFSGDKLLGGPQAGIVAGTEAAIAPLRRHPLMRALRLDKMTLAALDATLRLHAGDREEARARLPVLRMLAQALPTLEARARRLRDALAVACAGSLPIVATMVPSEAEAGGGAFPGIGFPSRAVALSVAGLPAGRLAGALRRAAPRPVIGRLRDERVLLDMFTVSDGDVDAIAAALFAIVTTGSGEPTEV